ncbi:MAG: formate dehydrogenase accessory sulfurtransferase FdhD [Bacteroidota bacterium]
MTERIGTVNIRRILADKVTEENDLVVVEEPLEIRIGYGSDSDRKQSSITVTMRTPGDDELLCMGFLYSEGIISSLSDVLSAKYCKNIGQEPGGDNIMRVELIPNVKVEIEKIERNFYTNSSCGVCGKASIDHVKQNSEPLKITSFKVAKEVLQKLPQKLLSTQEVFRYTGGLHACGLFTPNGEMILHKEDVGRHNALDKLIGSLVLSKQLPLNESILVLSGRISFELVQKAVNAGIPIVAGVGAPSTLSIDLANEYGVTLIGFLKENGFNIYTGFERVVNFETSYDVSG